MLIYITVKEVYVNLYAYGKGPLAKDGKKAFSNSPVARNYSNKATLFVIPAKAGIRCFLEK